MLRMCLTLSVLLALTACGTAQPAQYAAPNPFTPGFRNVFGGLRQDRSDEISSQNCANANQRPTANQCPPPAAF